MDLSKAMVIDTHNHIQTRCMLESWHIQNHQSPLNKERGTLCEIVMPPSMTHLIVT